MMQQRKVRNVSGTNKIVYICFGYSVFRRNSVISSHTITEYEDVDCMHQEYLTTLEAVDAIPKNVL